MSRRRKKKQKAKQKPGSAAAPAAQPPRADRRDGASREPPPRPPEARKRERPRKRGAADASAYPRLDGPWPLHAGAFALLVGLTCILYSGTLELGFFNVDDPGYVTANPWIQGFTSENLTFVLTQPYFANYSPVHLLSYMVDHAFGGLDPRTFHLSSNLWAGATAGMLYLVAALLLRSSWAAFATAVAFVVHPSHVEAVAWISSRKDLVAAFFALGSTFAYLAYRRRGRRCRAWYAASLALFVLGTAGKLSVVVLPAILFLFDVLVEKRRGWGVVTDKIPHALIVLFFGLKVMAAQPPTRHDHELFVIGHSLLESLWLLTGFGEHVLNRPKPEAADFSGLVRVLLALAPLALFAAPLAAWWRRASGLLVVLLYWPLLALVPPSVLSFVHPVTDRYLFFPSAGVALLLGWLAVQAIDRWGRQAAILVALVGVVLTSAWTVSTLDYLSEWRDPRSVWHAAAMKNPHLRTHQYLGSHHQDHSDQLELRIAQGGDRLEREKQLARVVWADDPRLEGLLVEWSASSEPGNAERRERSITAEYRAHLRELARRELEAARELKGARVTPNLFFRLGKLAMDRGDLDEAQSQFEEALDQAERHTSVEVKQELSVRSAHALALTLWRKRDYDAALRWLTQAEQQQQQLGEQWIPDIAAHRERLEALVGRSE